MADMILEFSRNFILQAAENATEEVKEKYKASTPGLATAYISILIMSVVPIFFGSFKSVTNQKSTKDSGEQPDTMSAKDAMMFPVIASCALFGLYIVFKIFGKEHVNMLLTFYFFFIGVLALAHVSAPIIRQFISETLVKNESYHLKLVRLASGEALIDYKFDHFDIIAVAASTVLGVWYLLKKHWIANNLFALAFAQNGIELLQLNSVATGCILLSGLFFYDVFWVFGTDVMVTVAKSFEAPIKLVFPQDFLEAGVFGKHHAMLGLGDIVVPGIFIALLLRYDLSKGPQASKIYFTVSFIAYVMGLVLTVVVMTVFKHAQPALLYLVPACVGSPLLVALILGEIKSLFQYRDNPEAEEDEKSTPAVAETSATSPDSEKRQTRSKVKKDN